MTFSRFIYVGFRLFHWSSYAVIFLSISASSCDRFKRDLNISLDTPQFAVIQDAAEEALQFVEDVRNAATCDGGTGNILNVLFDNTEWRAQANAAVRLSNLLTKNFQITNNTGGYVDDPFLFAMTRTTIEIEALAFGCAIAFEPFVYRNMSKFCAYSFHTGNETIKSHDISVEYDYFPSEWYLGAKLKYKNLTDTRASTVTQRLSEYDVNGTKVHKTALQLIERRVEYDDGFWTRPYFDCGGGNIWMITFNSPILAVINGTLDFAGVATCDVALSILDIDQCDPVESGKKLALNVFQGTHHCKASTKCVTREGLGFRRGTYFCYCRDGFYYPNTSASVPAFLGFDLEDAYSDWIQRGSREYLTNFECTSCPEGCETCHDATPCMAELNWILRSLLLCVVVVILLAVSLVLFLVIKYREHPVMEESGWPFFVVMCCGGIIATVTDFALFPRPTVAACTSRVWFEHVAFILIYGPLLLINWRLSVVYRGISRRKTYPPLRVFYRRLIILITCVILYLAAWTSVTVPPVVMVRTGNDLKFYMCQDTWMEDGILIAEAVFLIWGGYICYKLRSFSTPFNESKLISLIISVTFVMKHVLLVSRKFTIGRIGPDVLYLVYVLELQVPGTSTFLILFGTKLNTIRIGIIRPSHMDTSHPSNHKRDSATPSSIAQETFASKLEQHELANSQKSHS